MVVVAYCSTARMTLVELVSCTGPHHTSYVGGKFVKKASSSCRSRICKDEGMQRS